MANNKALNDRISAFFLDRLNLEVPPVGTDLIQEGILDSLGLYDFILYLEEEFGIEISFENLDADNFRSIEGVVKFIETHIAVQKN